jgi:thioester reductase-like protein
MPSILDQVERLAAGHPDKLLYSFLNLGGEEVERYTYAGFLHRIDAIAAHLRTEHGFASGDRLLLAYRPGLEMICGFFGCVRAGLIPVPVYPPSAHGFAASLYKMALIARDSGAAGILTSHEYRSSLESYFAANRNATDTAEAAHVSHLRRISTESMRSNGGGGRYAPSRILFLQYTSGSTGSPKGVMVTHENILHNCGLVANHESPVAVSWLPQYHDMGLIGYYLYAALSGGTTYGFSPLDFIQRPGLWLESITRYRASATSAPNFAFDYCLRPGRISPESLVRTDLSSLQFLMAAAEPVRPGTYQRFQQTFQPLGLNPRRFYVAYGLAENTLAVSSYGRTVLSVNRQALALRKVRATTDISEVAVSKRLVSCGKPLGDLVVRIVDPEKHTVLDDGQVGEIWVAGKSKCAGYWNKPELSERTFHARVVGESQQEEGYLRTGDLGFLENGELYVCGRIKDTIIVRGQNYYPEDIEQVVEDASSLVRPAGVAAFEFSEDDTPALAVIAEVRSIRSVPDPHELIAAIRTSLGVEAAVVALVAPKSICKTTSGKVSRQATRQAWLEGKLEILRQQERRETDRAAAADPGSPLEILKTRYRLTGRETFTLIEAGVDSLDLVYLMHHIQESLKQRGAAGLAAEVDVRIIQQISVADLFRMAEHFDRSLEDAVLRVRHTLLRMQENHCARERELMLRDRSLAFVPRRANGANGHASPGGILLTGGTGFLGPFLVRSLLEQTGEPIHVLVRAQNESAGKERLAEALASLGPVPERLGCEFDARVSAVCGNLAQPRLGLGAASWTELSKRIHTIYHNGAAVNYLHTYEKMRAANVGGTNEVIRLAFDGRRKVLNYVSTTFIFGWAVKEVLYETDCNHNMELLDFGYSQSKWAAEQVVFDAGRQGLAKRVFRPALISPSVSGGGNNLDIAIRLLAFMINHGVGVDALNQVSFVPADVVADNIVAICASPGTLNSAYHVTRDEYANMADITGIIERITGREFEMFALPDFVPAVIKRCTRDDLLYPLLDFLIGSVDSIASMEFKRYDSSRYRAARDASAFGQPDPSLEDTVLGILRFMARQQLIAVSPSALEPRRAMGQAVGR